MSLRVYNTLTREKEILTPVQPGQVGIYLCGPTVYKSPHVGHMVATRNALFCVFSLVFGTAPPATRPRCVVCCVP